MDSINESNDPLRLVINKEDSDALVVEKLMCLALLCEGTDVTQRVLDRFLKLKDAL